MPYVEILAPPAPPQSKALLAKSITDGLMSSFGVDAQTITLYFLPIAPYDYAHAGEMDHKAPASVSCSRCTRSAAARPSAVPPRLR